MIGLKSIAGGQSDFKFGVVLGDPATKPAVRVAFVSRDDVRKCLLDAMANLDDPALTGMALAVGATTIGWVKGR